MRCWQHGDTCADGRVPRRILVIRGHRVMLSADLAELYGVPTKALNQAVRRNPERFPDDFMFRLTQQEKVEVVTTCDHLRRLKFSPVRPYAFTEHGAIMVAGILNSRRAIEVSIFVVRAFVRLREIFSTRVELARTLAAMERRLQGHDEQIGALFEAIRQLMRPPAPPPRRIGFQDQQAIEGLRALRGNGQP